MTEFLPPTPPPRRCDVCKLELVGPAWKAVEGKTAHEHCGSPSCHWCTTCLQAKIDEGKAKA